MPVLPVLAPESQSLLPDVAALADMHMRTLLAKRAEVEKSLAADAIFSPVEGPKFCAGIRFFFCVEMVFFAQGWLVVACMHLADAATQLGDGLCHLESLLRKQLVSAIGKVVGPEDFAEYMRFHLKKLLKVRRLGLCGFFFFFFEKDSKRRSMLLGRSAMLFVVPTIIRKESCRWKRRLMWTCRDELPPRLTNGEDKCIFFLPLLIFVSASVEQGVCTYIVSGQSYPEQFWYLCKSCWSGGKKKKTRKRRKKKKD